MEDHIYTDEDQKEEMEELHKRIEKLEKEKTLSKCVYCGTILGNLIRLYSGWCCVKCFKENILSKVK